MIKPKAIMAPAAIAMHDQKRQIMGCGTLLLVGIANRWKHMVGYYFTGSSCKSTTLQ